MPAQSASARPVPARPQGRRQQPRAAGRDGRGGRSARRRGRIWRAAPPCGRRPWPPRWSSSAPRAHAGVVSILTPAEILIAARRVAGARPHLAAVAGIMHREDLWQLCRDELTGVDVRIDGWDIRGRWFGVVVGATPPTRGAAARRDDPLARDRRSDRTARTPRLALTRWSRALTGGSTSPSRGRTACRSGLCRPASPPRRRTARWRPIAVPAPEPIDLPPSHPLRPTVAYVQRNRTILLALPLVFRGPAAAARRSRECAPPQRRGPLTPRAQEHRVVELLPSMHRAPTRGSLRPRDQNCQFGFVLSVRRGRRGDIRRPAHRFQVWHPCTAWFRSAGC
jgi:hypothetical protein